MRDILKNIKIPGVLIAIILLYIISSIITPSIFRLEHLMNILRISPFLGIAAIGQMISTH
jgi:ribose/xylose/arabinose/galactoside ABC-type transport system permease subunit